MEILSPQFLTALLQIIGINIVLSGDNAVVIALAARSLPAKQQKLAVFWGSAAAIVMRVVLTLFAVKLLQLPWLKLIGAILLFWIGIKLITDEEEESHHKTHHSLWDAVKTILIADLVMSLDNVIAVAAAAHGSISLLVIGLAIGIPLIIFASSMLIKIMDRYPWIVTLGAALIGWVAGEMLWEEPILRPYTEAYPSWFHYLAAGLGALLVVAVGTVIAKRNAAQS